MTCRCGNMPGGPDPCECRLSESMNGHFVDDLVQDNVRAAVIIEDLCTVLDDILDGTEPLYDGDTYDDIESAVAYARAWLAQQ